MVWKLGTGFLGMGGVLWRASLGGGPDSHSRVLFSMWEVLIFLSEDF